MEIRRHAIYNLPISYTLLSEHKFEIEFKGSLSYHVTDIDLLKENTKGELELSAVNTLLGFVVQQTINSLLKDIDIQVLDDERPLIVNQLNVLIRSDFLKWGIDMIDIERLEIWSFDSSGT